MQKEILVTEMNFAVPSLLAATDDGKFWFEAVVSEADVVNNNRRLYPYGVLARAVEDIRPKLNRRPGTVDHPNPDQPLSISDNGIAWDNLRFDGNRLIGTGSIIETQKGLDLKANIKAGIAVGFSTRGRGLLERREGAGGVYQEMTSFTLETIDAVVNPSSVDARILNFVGEAEEPMDMKELIEGLATERAATLVAQGATQVAEHAKVAAETRATVAEAEVARLSVELTSANESIQTQVNTIAQMQLEAAGDPAMNRLSELTTDDLFGEAIRAEVTAALEATGAQPTIESIEKLVARYRPLVEGLAAAGNNGAAPRGVVEDVAVDEAKKVPTPARAELLRVMGLL